MSVEQEQKKIQVEVISILDMSGSMYNLRDDTIGGYNQYIDMIRKGKKENVNIYVTLIVFNTEVKFVYRRKLIEDVKNIDQDIYSPNGCTALNDAIGSGIGYMDEVIEEQKADDKVIQVAMYIQTDGMENSSEIYSKEQVKQMITERQSKGWDFIFAACNIDSFETGNSYGIKSGHIAQINSDGKAQGAIYRGLANRFNAAMEEDQVVGGFGFEFGDSDDIQDEYDKEYERSD